MTKQAILEKIEKRIKIKTGTKPEVILSLTDWQLIEDIILELSSTKLMKSVKKAREYYQKNKGVAYQPGV